LALAEILSDYWVSFAKTGKPTAADAPAWKRYRAGRGNYLELAAKPVAHRGIPNAEQVELVDQLQRARWQRFEQGEG
ncbi:MAG: carboxylesterase family protein, partial [Pseudomonadota bacterium]